MTLCNSQLLYTPQMILMVLSATSFSGRPGYINTAVAVHACSWIAQFIGHGFAEGRAPALLDNLVGGKSAITSCSSNFKP